MSPCADRSFQTDPRAKPAHPEVGAASGALAGLAVEEANQLRPPAVRQAADRLRLADAALVQEAGRLHPPELRDRHEHVEDLRRRDVLGRVFEDLLDARRAGLEVLLELRAPHADVIRSLERFHPLVEGAEWRLGLGLERGHGGGY